MEQAQEWSIHRPQRIQATYSIKAGKRLRARGVHLHSSPMQKPVLAQFSQLMSDRSRAPPALLEAPQQCIQSCSKFCFEVCVYKFWWNPEEFLTLTERVEAFFLYSFLLEPLPPDPVPAWAPTSFSANSRPPCFLKTPSGFWFSAHTLLFLMSCHWSCCPLWLEPFKASLPSENAPWPQPFPLMDWAPPPWSSHAALRRILTPRLHDVLLMGLPPALHCELPEGGTVGVHD